MKSTDVLAWQQRVVGTGYGAQVEAARLLNAPPQTYRNWLEGRTTPSGSVQKLMRYVEEFGRLEDSDDDPQARFRDATGKGFTVTCNHCGSKNVHLNNSLDYHPGDGERGSVTLKCWDCDDEIELLDGLYDRR